MSKYFNSYLISWYLLPDTPAVKGHAHCWVPWYPVGDGRLDYYPLSRSRELKVHHFVWHTLRTVAMVSSFTQQLLLYTPEITTRIMWNAVLFKQSVVFISIFLISRLCIILLNIRRRRTTLAKNMFVTKRGYVRTLIVLGSGTDIIGALSFGFW